MLDFHALEKANHSLNESILVMEGLQGKATTSEPLLRTLRAGVIQNFEFTYELSWKFLKRWLAENLGKTTVEGLSRRGLFRLAHEYKLIDSVEQWMLFHSARNETSHTYDESTAQEVLEISRQFQPVAEQTLKILKTKNDA